MQVYWLDMFSSRYFVEIFQKYLGKCTLLKNKESAVYCTPCPREVDCFSYNESSHKGMMGRKKKKKKLKYLRIAFMVIIHTIILSLLTSWSWHTLSWDQSALKPNTVFPFRKPEIASILCSEAPGLCSGFKMVKFRSLASLGPHIAHLPSLTGPV